PRISGRGFRRGFQGSFFGGDASRPQQEDEQSGTRVSSGLRALDGTPHESAPHRDFNPKRDVIGMKTKGRAKARPFFMSTAGILRLVILHRRAGAEQVLVAVRAVEAP